MTILGKPNAGAWAFNAAAFGANATPAPDSLHMMEEGVGAAVANAGKDAGSHDGVITGADWSGVQATGDGYLAFIAANSDTLDFASTFGITSYPFTLAAVVRSPTATGGVQAFASLGDASAGNVQYALQMNGSEQPSIRARNTSTIQQNVSGDGLADGGWHLVVAAFRSATDREVYIDGSISANDAISVTFNSNVDRAKLGALADSSPSNYLDGDIAAFMVWKGVGLSDAQVQTDLWNGGDVFPFLGAGASPTISAAGKNALPIVFDNEIRVPVVGTNFKAVQGGGSVQLHDYEPGVGSGNDITQVIEGWSDDALMIAVDKGVLAGVALWLSVTNSDSGVASMPVTVYDDPGADAVGRRNATLQGDIENGIAFSLDIGARFFASDAQDLLTLTVDGLPAGLAFDGNSVAGMPQIGAAANSPYTVTVDALDVDGNAAPQDSFQITVNAIAPVVPDRGNARRTARITSLFGGY